MVPQGYHTDRLKGYWEYRRDQRDSFTKDVSRISQRLSAERQLQISNTATSWEDCIKYTDADAIVELQPDGSFKEISEYTISFTGKPYRDMPNKIRSLAPYNPEYSGLLVGSFIDNWGDISGILWYRRSLDTWNDPDYFDFRFLDGQGDDDSRFTTVRDNSRFSTVRFDIMKGLRHRGPWNNFYDGSGNSINNKDQGIALCTAFIEDGYNFLTKIGKEKPIDIVNHCDRLLDKYCTTEARRSSIRSEIIYMINEY